jgi:DsbC/DsbD-like thiol-disulfide interchange protein
MLSLYSTTINVSSGATTAAVYVTGYALSQAALNAVTVLMTIGSTTKLTFGNTAGVQLSSASAYFAAGTGSTGIQFAYPELNGSTSATQFRYPIYNSYNATGGIQAATQITITNVSGTVNCVKTGLTASTVLTHALVF